MNWFTRALRKLFPLRDDSNFGLYVFLGGVALFAFIVIKIAPVYYDNFLIRQSIRQAGQDVHLNYQTQKRDVQKRIGELYEMKGVEDHDPKDVSLIRTKNEVYLEYVYQIDVEWPLVTKYAGYQTSLVFEITE